jgi:DNA-binding transcriptional ArsR family regulator
MDPKAVLSTHPLLSDRVRLAIMAALSAAQEPMEFMELLNSLELTKGNLSTHMRKLEDAGLVKVEKKFIERKPRTTFCCTSKGKKAMHNYLNMVETLINGLAESR